MRAPGCQSKSRRDSAVRERIAQKLELEQMPESRRHGDSVRQWASITIA